MSSASPILLKESMTTHLARISHRWSTASPQTSVLAALRSVGLLDVLHEYDCGGLGRKPCQDGPCGASLRQASRVEERRDGRRAKGVAVAGGFRHRAGASISTVTPFPLPAHRTGRALLPHNMWLTRISHQKDR